jgi:membrane-bound inhibitor of C-type lysozyme
MRVFAGSVLATGLFTAILIGPAVSATAQKSFTYRCDDGTVLTVSYLRFIRLQAARLMIDGKTIVLPQRRSADGGRYARGGIQFWIKGRSAMLMRQGKTTNCETN